jgi:hypothetical protein
MSRRTILQTLAILTVLAFPPAILADEPPDDVVSPAPAAPAEPSAPEAVPATAAVAEPPATGAPRWPGPHLGLRTIASVDLQGAYNPLGIQVIGSIDRRWVYDVDQKRNIEWSFVQAGLNAMVSPAIASAGLHMDWTPAAVLNLRFQTDVIGYYGVMGALRQFDQRPKQFDVDRNADSLPGRDRSGLAFRVMLQPTVALQVSKVIVRNQCNLSLYRFVGSGNFFYDYENDTLMAPTELLVFNQTFVLIETWKAKRDALLYVGALYDVTYAARTEVRRQRVGGIVLLQPKDPWGPLDRLRIYVMGGWIFEDQNRRNEPFVAGGIGTDFDL